MARQLKFRAWDNKNKVFPLIGFNIIGEVTIFSLVQHYQLENLVQLEISQFTGSKDCNGKEIYEGDIIKDNMMGYITEVAYIDNAFVSKSNIGNVGLFETPEIIK